MASAETTQANPREAIMRAEALGCDGLGVAGVFPCPCVESVAPVWGHDSGARWEMRLSSSSEIHLGSCKRVVIKEQAWPVHDMRLSTMP